MVAPADSRYVREGTGVGAGGRRLLTFQAVRLGSSTLRLKKVRGQQGAGSAPADTFQLGVRVLPLS